MPEKLMKKIEAGEFDSESTPGSYCAHGCEVPYPCQTGEGCSLLNYGRDCHNEEVG